MLCFKKSSHIRVAQKDFRVSKLWLILQKSFQLILNFGKRWLWMNMENGIPDDILKINLGKIHKKSCKFDWS